MAVIDNISETEAGAKINNRFIMLEDRLTEASAALAADSYLPILDIVYHCYTVSAAVNDILARPDTQEVLAAFNTYRVSSGKAQLTGQQAMNFVNQCNSLAQLIRDNVGLFSLSFATNGKLQYVAPIGATAKNNVQTRINNALAALNP